MARNALLVMLAVLLWTTCAGCISRVNYAYLGYDGQRLYFDQRSTHARLWDGGISISGDIMVFDMTQQKMSVVNRGRFNKAGPKLTRASRNRPGWYHPDTATTTLHRETGVRAIGCGNDARRKACWFLTRTGEVWFLSHAGWKPVISEKKIPGHIRLGKGISYVPPEQFKPQKWAQTDLNLDPFERFSVRVFPGEHVVWFAVQTQMPVVDIVRAGPTYFIVVDADRKRLANDKPVACHESPAITFTKVFVLDDAFYHTGRGASKKPRCLFRRKPDAPGQEEQIIDLSRFPTIHRAGAPPRLRIIGGRIVFQNKNKLNLFNPQDGSLNSHKFPDRRAAGRLLFDVFIAPPMNVAGGIGYLFKPATVFR